jgi:hypothetical protein
MAISDIYTVDSGLIATATTSQTPILELRTVATKRAFITGVRMTLGTTSAPAGNSALFTLARAGNSPTGGTAANLRANDAASATAISTAFIGAWTIAPTLGNILGEWELPQTTGSMWEEFPPLGYEWVAGVSTSIVGFITFANSTSTPIAFQFVVSE